MDDTPKHLSVPAELTGERLDKALALLTSELSRRQAQALIAKGEVFVNGRRGRKSTLLQAGDRISLPEDIAGPFFEATPTPDHRLLLHHEDADCVVVEKPALWPSHPLRPEEDRSVAQALIARFPEMVGVGYSPREPGIVHRLDIGTSGLMLAARSPESFQALTGMLRTHQIDKEYLALVASSSLEAQRIDAPIYTDPKKRRRVRVGAPTLRSKSLRRKGWPAVTEILAVEALGPYSLARIRANRATRHQIRAHCAFIGAPLVGDLLYGGPNHQALGHHFLHASRLRFTQPISQEALCIESPLSGTLLAIVEALRQKHRR